jgi:hypothetical protein
VTMMAGSLRPTPGVGTSSQSAVSWTSFFNLGGRCGCEIVDVVL